jgi:S1-C subfamily serine protease
VNALDLLIVGLVVAAAVGSYRLGFVTRVISWVFMAAGLLLGLRLLPTVLGWFEDAESMQLLIITLVVLLVGSFTGQAIGLLIGERVGVVIPDSAETADRIAGAAAGGVLALVLVWLVLPVMGDTPGWPARQASDSAVARFLDDLLPDAPDTVQAVQMAIGEEQFPQVFDALRPTPDLGAPPGETGMDPDLLQEVANSAVKVEGVACGRVLDGSGWVVAEDTVVTNAHVVAGQDETEIIDRDGNVTEGVVTAFDPDRDLAVVQAPGLGLDPLPVFDTDESVGGGVFGYPGGGDLRVTPFRIARELRARGRDIYNEGSTTRQVFEVSADLERGDSGSALVDVDGRVVAVAFAIAPDNDDVAYALTIDEVQPVVESAGGEAVSTGECL